MARHGRARRGGGDVRLRRHRLPPPAGDGARRPARREAVHRLVERVDRGSVAARGNRRVGRGYAPDGFYLPSLATSARSPACVSGSFPASMKWSRPMFSGQIGRAASRERGCQNVSLTVVGVSLTTTETVSTGLHSTINTSRSLSCPLY